MPRRSIEESKIRISSTTVVETRKKKRSRRTKDPEEPSQMTRLKPRAPQEQEGSDEPTSENGYVESMKKTYYVISSAQCFFYLDEVIMAIVSILDHITDLTLLISWMDPDSDVPLAVVILSSLSVGITMIVPVFMYKECYIKIAMLCFCGMLALIYRVNSDPDSLQKLTWATEKRGSISMALFELKKGEKLIQKIIAEHDERKAQIAPHKMTPAIREKFKKKLDLAKIVEVKNAFKRLRRIEDRETMKELMEDLEIPKRVEYSDEIDLKEFISKLMKIQRRNTSDLLEYHAPRLYKMFEAICESLPQLLLQIYVLMMRDGSLIEKASQDYLLVFSLVSSFVSHAYSGMKLLYPENSKQAMIAFLATLIDTLFRSIGFLYLFVAMEFSLRRLIFLLSYISLSIILFNFIVVYVESRDSIFYSMILPFLYAFVFCFSAVTGLFLMVNAFDTDTDRMQCILVSELLFRIVSLCLLLYGALDANVQLMCAFVATTGFLTFIFYSIIFFFSLVENIPRSNYGNIFVDRLGWSLLPFLFILIVPIMPFVFFLVIYKPWSKLSMLFVVVICNALVLYVCGLFVFPFVCFAPPDEGWFSHTLSCYYFYVFYAPGITFIIMVISKLNISSDIDLLPSIFMVTIVCWNICVFQCCIDCVCTEKQGEYDEPRESHEVLWQYEGDRQGVWITYPEEVCQGLEEIWASQEVIPAWVWGRTSPDTLQYQAPNGSTYEIIVERMIQRNRYSNKGRRIRRIFSSRQSFAMLMDLEDQQLYE